MRKVILFICLIVIFGLLRVHSVPLDQDPALSQTRTRLPTWTIMVYLDADNNLESAGIDDFLEMSSVGSTADVNIVVQFDRISGYSTSYDNWTSTKRYYITSGMTPTVANALADLGELNMGDPATLVDFVNWAKTNYPATNYAVVLWNHGGGWRKSKEELWQEWRKSGKGKKDDIVLKAVCWDDTSGGDCLYMNEVQGALSSSGGAQLIGFDACLMSMVEVAYEVKGYGQVMVGSEETEPGDGWPYNTILADLTTNPSWTAAQLGSAIVDRYYQSYGNSQTQAAVDLANMNTLASTISTFAQAMIDYWDSDQAAVRSAAQDVMTQIGNTVINEKHGSGWPGAHGLAIYFPETSGSFSSDYNSSIIDFANDTQWEEFLLEFYGYMSGSWIAERRASAQEFSYTTHIDLYHFCELINLVQEDYYTESQISHEYLGGGTAQGFYADDGYITYALPFDFPYFGETISTGSTIYISSNGYVDLSSGSSHTDYSNSTAELAANQRIAPCWGDLTLDGSAQAGEDVYITENAESLVVRWVAETYGDAAAVNFELVLYQDGRIQFNYDGGNADISPWGTAPTIGISKGDSINYYLSLYNGQTALTNVNSDLFTPLASQPDMNVKFKNKNLANGSTLNAGTIPLAYIVGKEFTFTIQNVGGQELELTGSPDMVTLSGPDAKYFTVTQQPLTNIIAPGNSTTFKIRTKKTTPPTVPDGWQKNVELTVNIPNTDPDENPYTFTARVTVVN